MIGGSGEENGKFQCITGIAVDNKDYLYVVDGHFHSIQKLQRVSQFGSSGTGEGQVVLVLVKARWFWYW